MLSLTARCSVAAALALTGAALIGPAAAAPDEERNREPRMTEEQKAELRRTGHVSFTRETERGTVTQLVQRGAVTAVSATSISLMSKDGFSHTYAVSDKTRVREDGKSAAISSVTVGERAMLMGVALSKGDMARSITTRTKQEKRA